MEDVAALIVDTQAAVLSDEGVDALEALSQRLATTLHELQQELRALRESTAEAPEQDAKHRRAALRSDYARLRRVHRTVQNELLYARLYDTCAAKLGSMRRVRMLDGLIFVLIFVVIGMLIVEYSSDIGERAQLIFAWVDTAICVVFLGEFFFKVHCAPSRVWYFRRHWIDFFASLPFAGIVRLGRLARVARLARLARLVRVVRAVVFLQSRVVRSVQKNRTSLDREYELSFESVRSYLEGFSRRPTRSGDAEGKLLAWLIDGFERSWVLRLVERLSFGLIRRRATARARHHAEATQSTAPQQPEATGGRLAGAVAGVEGAVRYMCDFNGIVTTPQLLNYVGQALFKAGKRRGIVLFAVGVFGAGFGFLIKQAFVPHAAKLSARRIDITNTSPGRPIRFGDVVCGGRASSVPLILRLPLTGSTLAGSVVDVRMDKPGPFKVDLTGPMPATLARGQTVKAELEFAPAQPGDYRGALIIQRGDGVELRRLASGRGIESLAYRIAMHSTQSFGLNFVLISLPFLAVALVGWRWVNKSKRLTQDYKNVAEASFLNLMEDAKRLTMFDDLCWLYDEVLRPEALLDYGHEAVAEQERGIRSKIAALIEQRRKEDARFSVEDLGYDRSILPDDGRAGLLTHSELAMTREGFVLEAIQVISRGRPVASMHNAYGSTALQLYRDHLDGAIFHETDRKTIEQLLGNITIRRVLQRIGYTNQDTKRLQKLAAAFGSNLWLTFICRSVAEQTGRMVSEFNASCVPVRDLGTDDVRGDRALRGQYEAWLAGGPQVEADNYMTREFNAMHFLVADEGQDRRVLDVFGPRVLAKLEHERCRMIRTIFGTYPWGPSIKVNPYQLYERLFGQSVQQEIQISRLRRALGVPQSLFRVVVLPLRVLIAAARAAVWTAAWLRRFILNILADVETEQERPDFDAAIRKITRMRGPVIAEASAIRARFDPAYLGCGLPDRQESRCIDDLRSIDAAQATLDFYRQRRDDAQRQLDELGCTLREMLDAPLAGEALRAAQTAYLLDAQGLRTLMRAEPFIHELADKLATDAYDWPRGAWLKIAVHKMVCCLSLGRSRLRTQFDQFCKLTGREPGRARQGLFKAYLLDLDGVCAAIDAIVRTEGQPCERAKEMLSDIADGRSEEWTTELITVRTVHALALLDRRNYEVAVYSLGRFDEVGAHPPQRMGGRAQHEPAPCAG